VSKIDRSQIKGVKPKIGGRKLRRVNYLGTLK